MAPRFQREAYTIGWVCALPIELAAAQEMLDEEHEDLEQDENDSNIYSLGSIGGHKVVLACLPAGQTGNNSAAVVATQMRATFKGIRFGLMVGIGGGVPSEEVDIRLGDVVVSQPIQAFGGVVQYDSGEATPSGFKRMGSLNTPPPILLNAVAKMQANHFRRRSNFPKHVSKLSHIPEFTRASAGPDILFEATYNHVGGRICETCSADQRVVRRPLEREDIVIHYGTIASGNKFMRDGATRDAVSVELGGVLCFEMEAAGLMSNFPRLVIRGICDYADSHNNKKWQAYAAGTAAACAKEVLLVIPPAEVAKIRTVQEAIEATSEYLRAPSYYIPFSRNPRFVGRIAELDALTQKLFIEKGRQKVTLVGLGGIGKTQVALKFAYFVKDRWPEYSIFWIPALSLESFEQACTEIARILHIPLVGDKEDVKELVRQYLSAKKPGKWLLIVDNADDMEIIFGAGRSKGLANYLPEREDGLIVFTTRHQEVAVSLTGNDVVELEKMDYNEAVDFLDKSLIRKDPLLDNTITAKLLDKLDYLPLAIAQAVAYVNTNKMFISEYLPLLESTEQGIICVVSREFHDGTRYENSANAVATTWVISFNQIRKYDTVAADLLAYMCCIEWKAIPRSILPQIQPKARMIEAIGTLCAYQFTVKRENEDNEDTYDVHRLVHLATRIWVNQCSSMAETREKATRHLAQVFPSSDYTNRELWREYLPHVIRLLKDTEQEGLEVRYELCLMVGQCLQVDGRIRESVAWLEDSYYWRKSHLVEDHPDRLASQHELATAYQSDGQVQKAVELLEHVVIVQEKVLAEDHPSRLASQHVLATAYQSDGQVQKAVELLEHVVTVREKVLAEDHPSRLASQHMLARVYQANGQVQKAVELLEHVVTVQEKVLAKDHPSRLASQHALATAYQSDGQAQKAVELLEPVVIVHEKVLAEDHLSRLASQHALAIAYQSDGQVQKAVELLEYIVAVQEKVLAEDHPSRLASQHALAIAYQSDGQVQKAVELLEHIVIVREKVLAEDHPSRLASQHALAIAYQTDGQVQKAVELLEYIVAVQEKVLAKDHPSRLASQHTLAIAYQSDGQVEKAVELLEHVVAVREKVLAKDHPSRLASQHTLAIAYQTDGQVQKAVELLEYIVAVQEKVLAEDHPSRLASQHVLATAYQSDGQVQKAVELLEHVVTVQEKVLAEDHPSRLASQHALAIAYQSDGQVQKAVELLEYIVVVQEKVLAKDHPSRLASQHALATAYQSDGQVQKAVELLEHVVAVREKVLAKDHPSRLASQHALAMAYQVDYRVQKAVELLEHVVAVQEKVLAEGHPDRLSSQHALATAYRADRQVQKAVELLEHVVAVREKVLAEDHPSRLASQHALATAYQSDGQVQKAVELLEHVVAVREKVLAEDHPSRLASQHELAIAYQADGQVEKAVELLEHVVAVREKMLAEDHPDRLASQHALAIAYRADGQVQKAVKLLSYVVIVKLRVFRKDHPSRLISQSVLASWSKADI